MTSHLLFKFHHTPRAKTVQGITIELHQQVASKNGSVWWGQSSVISQDKAEALKLQIRNGIPTYAFLYCTHVPKKIHSDGILWYRALVRDVVLSKPASTENIPEYYRHEELDFYTLLSDIEEITFGPGQSPKVPGQAAIRHVSFEGNPIPENLTFAGNKNRKIFASEEEILIRSTIESDNSEKPFKLSDDFASRVIDLQYDIIMLKDEIAHLKTYKDHYDRIIDAEQLFSSEKFFETWIQENMHKIFSELEIIDRQPGISWPDGKFGRLDLLACNKETKDLVIIEVKTHKRSKNSGYDQYLRYTSWAKRNTEQLKQKYLQFGIQPTTVPQFILITNSVNDEMKAICKDHGIILIHVFGGLVVEKFI